MHYLHSVCRPVCACLCVSVLDTLSALHLLWRRNIFYHRASEWKQRLSHSPYTQSTAGEREEDQNGNTVITGAAEGGIKDSGILREKSTSYTKERNHRKD